MTRETLKKALELDKQLYNLIRHRDYMAKAENKSAPSDVIKEVISNNSMFQQFYSFNYTEIDAAYHTNLNSEIESLQLQLSEL